MRATLAFLSLPLLSLAACGGGGSVNSLGTIAPPGGGLSGTPTPTPGDSSNFLDVSAETTFNAVGGLQSVDVDAQGATLYQGNASTVDSPSGTITYNPRDGIFTLALSDNKAGISRNVRFQDPAHRTDGNPGQTPAYEVPQFAGFNYLEALDGDADTTFFYQRPGTTTDYVSLGGFVHSTLDPVTGAIHSEHGALVFGAETSFLQVPSKGSGHYDGDFLATMANTSSFDTGGSAPIFQWLSGTSSIDVDFATADIDLALNGVVGKAYVNDLPVSDLALNVPTGATFSATGSASINSARDGFVGKFSSAGFIVGGTSIPVDFTSVNPSTSTAGASSIDGTFYGPNAVNVGGNFRITGGVPDQRIDILGAFTGAKK